MLLPAPVPGALTTRGFLPGHWGVGALATLATRVLLPSGHNPAGSGRGARIAGRGVEAPRGVAAQVLRPDEVIAGGPGEAIPRAPIGRGARGRVAARGGPAAHWPVILTSSTSKISVALG